MNPDQNLSSARRLAVFLTGGSGLVGGALWQLLHQRGQTQLTLALRKPLPAVPDAVHRVRISSLEATDWLPLLQGQDVVVHAAARVHVLDERAADPLAEFRRVNVAGTLALASAAATAGVRRFVFVSSVKAAGESSLPGRPLQADDRPRPEDAYGISKHEAEQGLLELAKETGMQVVIVRPVLVYGPGVAGNFARMMRWLRAGWPLPLASVDNRRSLLALDNLADLLACCIEHPAAANQIFMASDGEDVSTPELLRRLAYALQQPLWLLPCPPAVLRLLAACCGKRAEAQRLLGNLQVDIGKTRQLLDWTPPLSVTEGLQRLQFGETA